MKRRRFATSLGSRWGDKVLSFGGREVAGGGSRGGGGYPRVKGNSGAWGKTGG